MSDKILNLSDKGAGMLAGAIIGNAFGAAYEYGKSKVGDDFMERDYEGTFVADLISIYLAMWDNKRFDDRRFAGEVKGLLARNPDITISNYLKGIIEDPKFAEDPKEVSARAYENAGGFCNNSTLLLTCATSHVDGVEEARGRSLEISQIFLAGEETSVIIVFLSFIMMMVSHESDAGKSVGNLVEHFSRNMPKEFGQLKEKMRHVYKKRPTLAELNLTNSGDNIVPSFLTAIYALRMLESHSRLGGKIDIEKVLRAVASEGGSASVNCGIVMAIIGAHVGYAGIDEKFKERVVNFDFIRELVEAKK